MPLPPALLARLKKRGIVEEGPREEVIAESYDDEIVSGGGRGGDPQPQKLSWAAGCPNKWNPYHMCTEFCWDFWSDGTPEERLNSEYQSKRNRMLKKYPLPVSWKEVYDPGIARHYYWNQETDEVCWLSPVHPKAVIGEAAPKIAKVTFDKIEKAKHEALMKATAAPSEDKSKRRKRRSPSPQREPSSEESDNEEDGESEKRKRRKGRNDLDPMDPAAYGECERGKWSSGLDTRGEATTGVDTTATGPLFQMRPYPSPGAILRKNAEMGKK